MGRDLLSRSQTRTGQDVSYLPRMESIDLPTLTLPCSTPLRRCLSRAVVDPHLLHASLPSGSPRKPRSHPSLRLALRSTRCFALPSRPARSRGRPRTTDPCPTPTAGLRRPTGIKHPSTFQLLRPLPSSPPSIPSRRVLQRPSASLRAQTSRSTRPVQEQGIRARRLEDRRRARSS